MNKKLGYKVLNIINIIVCIGMMILITQSYIGKRYSFNDFTGLTFLLLAIGILNWPLISMIFSIVHLKSNYSKPTTKKNEIAFYIVVVCFVIPSILLINFMMFIFGWGQKHILNDSLNFAFPVTIMYFVSIGVSVLKLIIDLIIFKKNNNSTTTK